MKRLRWDLFFTSFPWEIGDRAIKHISLSICFRQQYGVARKRDSHTKIFNPRCLRKNFVVGRQEFPAFDSETAGYMQVIGSAKHDIMLPTKIATIFCNERRWLNLAYPVYTHTH